MFNTAHCASILPQARLVVLKTVTAEADVSSDDKRVAFELKNAGPSSTTTILGRVFKLPPNLQ